jgi:hypothetical protein
MSFHCAASIDGAPCGNTEPGDHIYLGFLPLCVDHQAELEGAINDRRLSHEVASALLERTFGHIFRNWNPPSPQSIEESRASTTVYFMRCGGFYKIGHSGYPAYRLSQIRGADGTKAPEGLNLKATMLVKTEPGGYLREQELHAKFAHLRHTGEWFTEAPELTEYIESLAREQAA